MELRPEPVRGRWVYPVRFLKAGGGGLPNFYGTWEAVYDENIINRLRDVKIVLN